MESRYAGAIYGLDEYKKGVAKEGIWTVDHLEWYTIAGVGEERGKAIVEKHQEKERENTQYKVTSVSTSWGLGRRKNERIFVRRNVPIYPE